MQYLKFLLFLCIWTYPLEQQHMWGELSICFLQLFKLMCIMSYQLYDMQLVRMPHLQWIQLPSTISIKSLFILLPTKFLYQPYQHQHLLSLSIYLSYMSK